MTSDYPFPIVNIVLKNSMIVCVFVLKYWKNILYIIEDYKKKIKSIGER